MSSETTKFSPADFVCLLCAIAIIVAFLFMPWLNTPLSPTGLRLLTNAEQGNGYDVSILFLVPVAGIVGGVAGLAGLMNSRFQSNMPGWAVVGGVIGLIYYGMYLFFNSQAQFDSAGLIGSGFWIALFGAIGLVVQVFIPRPAGNRKTSKTVASKPSALRDMFERMGILGELLMFLWRRKLYWLIPMVITLILVAVLIILGSNPATQPFIYTLF